MEKLKRAGELVSRYGVVFILLAFGTFKFTHFEANSIKPFIDHSPIFNWMYHFTDIQGISDFVGVVEIIAAIGIASRFFSARASFYGSLLGCIIFVTTLSFLITTPGLISKTEGFWLPDGFVIKDLVLLGFCLWSAGESYENIKV